MKHLNIPFRAFWGLLFLSCFLCGQKNRQHPDIASRQTADRLYDQGKTEQALPLYEQAYHELLAGNHWEAAVQTGLRICSIHSETGNTGGDLPRLHALLDITRLHMPNEHFLLGECCNAIGQWFYDAGVTDSAQIHFTEASQHFHQIEDWANWGNAQTGIAACCYAKEQYPAMDSVLRQTERAAKGRIKTDEEFWGGMYNLYGAFFNATGRYQEGLENSLREIAFCAHRHDTASLAIAYNNIGDLYLQWGDYDRALQYFRAHLQMTLELPYTSQTDHCNAYLNLSETWYRKKNFDKAFEWARQAQDALKGLPPATDPGSYTRVYNDLAAGLIEQKEYRQALAALQKALPLHALLPAQQGVETSWHNLSNVYRMLGDYPNAEVYLQKAMTRYSAIRGRRSPELGKACRHLGYIRQLQGDLPGALTQYQRALGILVDTFPEHDLFANPALKNVQSNLDVLRTFSEKGKALQQLAATGHRPGALEASLAAYQLAIDLLDSMRNEYQEGSVQFWSDDARPIFERAITVAYQLYHDTNDPHYLESAFRYAEKSKAVLLASALQESAARRHAGIPDDLLEAEKACKIDIAFYQKLVFEEQLKGQGADFNKTLLWQRAILDRRQEYERLLARFKADYPAYFQAKYAGGLPGIDDLQKSLAPQTTLVEYFLGDEHIYAFCFSREKASFSALDKPAGFQARLEDFIRQLRDRETVVEKGLDARVFQDFAGSASRFYEQLLRPLFDAPPQRLLLVTDGTLGYLPFELLLSQPFTDHSGVVRYDTLPYLLKNSIVRYEYSAAIALQPLPSDRSRSLFAGFAPQYAAAPATNDRSNPTNCETPDINQFPPLQNNLEEVSAIARLVRGLPFLASEATEAQFKKEAGRFCILHLAMHGFINDCDPSYSGLVFTQASKTARTEDSLAAPGGAVGAENDGFLYAYEIYNMHLYADLAVLSACNTGLGQLARGEGIMSLARAFKYAGCPNILMSLWQADDKATSSIMLQFYTFLRQGMQKDEALRQAKLDYLRRNDRNHPFFWGTFVLIGDDRPVMPGRPWWMYALSGALLTGIGVFAYRRFQGAKKA